MGGIPVFYLVMDYIPGKTLERWSCDLGGDHEALMIRLQVAQQIATAMVVAHETTFMDQVGFEVQGVLHGDLKTANGIVNPSTNPFIMDFLLVDVQRLLDPRVFPEFRPYERKIVRTTAAFGTPGFMAPEQSEHGIVTVSTDIYGLGITLCHLLLPNENSPEVSVKRDAKLPRFIKELLSDMTASEPGKRPESMREVARRIGFQRQSKWYQKWMPVSLSWLNHSKK